MFHKPRSWPSINRLTAARLSFYSHPFDFRLLIEYLAVRCASFMRLKENRWCVSGGSMEIGDITEARRNGDRFAESSLGHPAELWAPPLVPTVGAPSSGDNLLTETPLACNGSCVPSPCRKHHSQGEYLHGLAHMPDSSRR